MANGPQDYRDPKVTTTGTTTGRSSMNWLWYVLGALLLLLLLGWLLGLFGADDTATATDATATEEPAPTEGVVVTEDPAATDGAATDGAAGDAVIQEPATDGATGTTDEVAD